MNFKQWSKTKEAKGICREHKHLFSDDYRRMECEECIWEAAQRDLAKRVLMEAKYWQKKVTAEKCLNDTIEKLEKEAKSE